MSAEVSVEDSIRQAMGEIENREVEAAPEEKEPEAVELEEVQAEEAPKARERDETGKFTKAEKKEKAAEAVVAPKEEKAKTAAPQSWPAEVKNLWDKLPPEFQTYATKRELEIHQNMTRHDGELRVGRELKEVITPYMPIITAEGGTPAKAVQSLLNTAYQLRTGTPEKKVELLQQIATQYGIDLARVNQPAQNVDPMLQSVMQRLDSIDSRFTQQSTLQEKQEFDRLQSEVAAFAAKPENAHFETVKPAMASLLGSNQAKDLQEAYDMACWANPEIRSTLMAAQEKELAEKRKAELAKKKQAAVSVSGSPGPKNAASTPQNKTVEDELRDVYDDIIGSRI